MNIVSFLHKAIRSHAEQISDSIANGSFLKKDNGKKNYTPLMQACDICFVDGVKRLIEKGVDVNEKDITGRTALFYLVNCGVFTVFENKSKYVNLKNFETILNELVKAGADINARDKRGHNLITTAYENKDYKLRSFLIKYIEKTKTAEEIMQDRININNILRG